MAEALGKLLAISINFFAQDSIQSTKLEVDLIITYAKKGAIRPIGKYIQTLISIQFSKFNGKKWNVNFI